MIETQFYGGADHRRSADGYAGCDPRWVLPRSVWLPWVHDWPSWTRLWLHRTTRKKKSRKLFFSEEKNQKTFTPAPAARSRPWPRSWKLRRTKSLLLLFFTKEGLFHVLALRFAPPVDDFAAAGFPLIGGRLDFFDGHTAAALSYRHRQHIRDLFIWRVSIGARSAGRTRQLYGFDVQSWVRNGMVFAAVSNLSAAELADFVRVAEAS
jgi:hypothetical protein